MLLTVNLVFTILIFLILAAFVTIIIITGLYVKRNIPMWSDELDKKKNEVDNTINEARDKIIEEFNKN